MAKMIGNGGSEKEVRFYSAFAKNRLKYYLESGMLLWHNDMYEVLADARDIQENYAKRDAVTDKQMRNTQRDVNRFLKGAPQEEAYRIKEFVPCPDDLSGQEL